MNESTTGAIKACQVCAASPLELIVRLGHHAPVHAHVTKEKLSEPEISYPLNLCRCSNCGLIQLDHIVDPKVLFYAEYPYFTGMTKMLIENFKELAKKLVSTYNIKPGSLIVDVGSNDGTLLAGFNELGLTVLGVEPTNVAQVAIKNGIPTRQEFFSDATAQAIVATSGKASVVTATNMFAHVNNVFGLAKGIADILSDDGVFVSESQYLVDMIEKTALDTIYHEHLRYYSLKPLIKLLESVGLSVVDAERIPAAGGSIRVYARRGKHTLSANAEAILKNEEAMGLYDGTAFKNFGDKILKIKLNLVKLLIECRQKGTIVGIGAPGRSNTLLNFAHIDTSLLDYAVEKAGSPKIGLFTPGTHIPIVDEKRLVEDQPEFALLLSWHIGDELVKKLRAAGYKGTFISPLPEPKLLTL